MFRAEVGDAPTKMNGVKPEFFFEGGGFAEPVFEVVVRGLPILPDGGGRFDGAGFGAEIINI